MEFGGQTLQRRKDVITTLSWSLLAFHQGRLSTPWSSIRGLLDVPSGWPCRYMNLHADTGVRTKVPPGRASLRTQVAIASLAVMLYLACPVFKMTLS